MKLRVAPITKSDLEKVMLEWAVKESWDYSQEDVDAYFAINASHIYALKHEDDVENRDNLIGCVSLTQYKQDNLVSIASIGLFIVTKNYRGQKKYGPFLWQNVINSLSDIMTENSVICLNSVSKVQSFYEQKGFFTSGIKNSSYKLDLQNFDHEYHRLKNLEINSSAKNVIRLEWNDINRNKIIDYEKKMFKKNFTDRQKFIEIWCARSDAIIIGYVEDAVLRGYSVLTICKKHKSQVMYRISPMYSDSSVITEYLLYSMIQVAIENDAKYIALNICESITPENLLVFENYGFKKINGGETSLMITKNKKLLHSSASELVALAPLEFPHESILLNGSN